MKKRIFWFVKKLFYLVLISLFILLFLNYCSNEKNLKSKHKPKPKSNHVITSFRDIENISEDSLSYRITRSENNYPVVHIPLIADSQSKIWRGIDLKPKPPVYPQSVKQEQASFNLKPGYHIESVLSDPKIHQPAAIKFDGDGRMYVVELRTFMRDLDATGETSPLCVISRWEDTDNDGKYDHGTIFVDSLVFPRFVVPFGRNTILTMESNHDNIYKYTDTNGDGKADKKELFATGMGHVANLEGQTAYLTWNLDNWMYSTYNDERIRWTPDGVIKEEEGYLHGEWGVTHDNYGNIWSMGGNSGVPEHFQFPIEYGNFHVEGALAENFREPYSLVQIGDYQPGMGAVKPDGSLAYMTSTAGCVIYRGDRLPKKLVGDFFFGAPMARTIRRVKITKKEGVKYLSNYYDHSEFIQSTDPLFRPLGVENAPDGTLYIVDMYHGIIQEGTFTPRGSYLRAKILQYQLDKDIDMGRIWRVTYKNMGRDTRQPHMLEESSKQLVHHLTDPNGWWRSTAQKLLVLRQDKSVVPALINMVNTSDFQLARIHALWTLEGLDALKFKMVRKLMNDPNFHMRIQAIRASETLYKHGVKQDLLADEYQRLIKDQNVNVVIQAMLTLNEMNVKNAKSTIKSVMSSNDVKGVQVVGEHIMHERTSKNNLKRRGFTSEQIKLYKKGAQIYTSICATCHGMNGLGGKAAAMAPPLSDSKRVTLDSPEYVVKTLLHGLKGPIKGKTYTRQVMPPRGTDSNQWIAAVASFIRKSMGNQASFVKPGYVEKVRKATSNQKGLYKFPQLINSIPYELTVQENWEVTASSSASASPGLGSTSSPNAAFTFAGWETTVDQKPGMWFEVNLRKPVKLTEIHFGTSSSETAPQKYTVEVSLNGKDWKQVAKGRGGSEETIIKFETVKAQYVRINEKAKANAPWVMRMLKFYGRK